MGWIDFPEVGRGWAFMDKARLDGHLAQAGFGPWLVASSGGPRSLGLVSGLKPLYFQGQNQMEIADSPSCK
jgi:hypothetical protein